MKTDTNSKSVLTNILEYAIPLALLACATIYILFAKQQCNTQRVQLQQKLDRELAIITQKKKEIANLQNKISFYTGEQIKQHAKRLGLRRPDSNQVVTLDSSHRAYGNVARYTPSQPSRMPNNTANAYVPVPRSNEPGNRLEIFPSRIPAKLTHN